MNRISRSIHRFLRTSKTVALLNGRSRAITVFKGISATGVLCGSLMIAGCQKSDTNPVTTDAAPKRPVVTTVGTATVPFDIVKTFTRGTALKLLINRTGTTVEEQIVYFEGVLIDGFERLIIARTPDTVAIGAGDSGSPLLTEDGKIIGALCYGYDGANTLFLARTIEDVITADSQKLVKQLSRTASAPAGLHRIECAYVVSGIDRPALERMQGNQRLKAMLLNNAVFPSGVQSFGKRSAVATADSIIPGMSISLSELTGDLVNVYAVGTLSYVMQNKMYAFGHDYYAPLARQIAKPICLARMQTMVESSLYAFKLAQPTTQVLGTMTGDHPFAITIKRDTVSTSIPVETSISLFGGPRRSFTHYVSYDIDKWWEQYMTNLAMYAPAAHQLNYHLYYGTAVAKIKLTFSDRVVDTTISITDTAQPDSLVPSVQDTTISTSQVNYSWGDIAGSAADAAAGRIYDLVKTPFSLRKVAVDIDIKPDTANTYISF